MSYLVSMILVSRAIQPSSYLRESWNQYHQLLLQSPLTHAWQPLLIGHCGANKMTFAFSVTGIQALAMMELKPSSP